jgi:hypothetical protein
MRALLLNTRESPCPGTHYAACTEFLDGFSAYGFEPGVARSLEEASGAEILLLSSHRVSIPYLQILNQYAPNAVYILWFYFDHIQALPFKRYILTSEYWHHPPTIQPHLRWYNMLPSLPNYVPLLLRANEDPAKIGTYPRTVTRDGCFMGTPYKAEWATALPNVLYHNINRSGLLPYSARRDIYLSSKIAFGFHADDNIANSHVTQRVFEALCYGCVVLSDNPAAAEITGGIVEYISNKEEFLAKYAYYLAHPEECRRKELAGYEWAKLFGTNRYAASLFVEKLQHQ